MDATYLRKLKRAELQKLAKEYEIKANLKSEVIIDVLLQRFSESKNVEVKDRTSHARLISGTQTLPRSAPKPLRSVSIEEPRYQAVDKDSEGYKSFQAEPTRRISTTPPDATYFGRRTDATEVSPDPRHDIYYPDSPPDYSKREDLPADEYLIKGTVEIMVVIDRDNQIFLERITKLRAAAAELRSQAKAIRSLVRGEDFSRIRIMTYLTYWQPINDEWSYQEVWSGDIKIRHPDDFAGVTSSDEEDMEELGDEQDAVHLQSNLPEQTDETTVAQSSTSSDSAAHLPTDIDLLNRATTEIESFNIVTSQKRPRELDGITYTELDGLRYTPRRRTQDKDPQTPERKSRTIKAKRLEQFDRFSPPPTPTPGRTDTKGKGRMTAEQVERLERERQAERFLAEIAAENLGPRLAAEPLRPDQGDLANVPQSFMELQANMRNVKLQHGMWGLRPGLGSLLAFSSASQQPRSSRSNLARQGR